MQNGNWVNMNQSVLEKERNFYGKMKVKMLFCCLTSSSETATNSEKHHFLGFASFVSGLGPHPFLPALLGVVSVQSPLMMVTEELQHRDLLGFLWRCRQV